MPGFSQCHVMFVFVLSKSNLFDEMQGQCSPYPSLAVGLVARISRVTANTSNIGEFRFGAMLSGCVLAPSLWQTNTFARSLLCSVRAGCAAPGGLLGTLDLALSQQNKGSVHLVKRPRVSPSDWCPFGPFLGGGFPY